jgi:hypothetical protein
MTSSTPVSVRRGLHVMTDESKQAETIRLLGHRAPLFRNSHVFLSERVPALLAGKFRALLALRGSFAALVGFCFQHGALPPRS